MFKIREKVVIVSAEWKQIEGFEYHDIPIGTECIVHEILFNKDTRTHEYLVDPINGRNPQCIYDYHAIPVGRNNYEYKAILDAEY